VDAFDPAAAGTAGGIDGCVAGQADAPSNRALPRGPQPVLRPYQETAIARVEADPHRRAIVVAPTGSGKTVLAAELIRRARARGERCLFVDHRREITDQTCKKLFAVGIDFGVIQAGFAARPGEAVQVASIQTLRARAIRGAAIELPSADLIFIDEAHHARAETYRRLVEAYPQARILGLTATPCRGDGRGLGNLFEMLIEVASVADLTTQGWLVPAKVYAPSRPDLTGVHVRRGDYVEDELAARMNTAQLVGDVIEHWLKLGERRRTVVFTVNVAHSVHIRDEFRRAGVLAEHIDGTTLLSERDCVLARLKAGGIEIVTNCQVLTEGWDCPEVACIVLARPTKSLGLYRQMVGRVLRPALNKTDCIVIDHSGAVFVHGFVDDPIAWTLDEDRHAENTAHSARGKRGGAPGLTDCPECRAVRMKGQPCQVCGWRPTPKPRHVNFADGSLGEVSRDRIAAGTSAVERRRFHAMLVWIAEAKGFRPGWAAHKYREKFGEWPPSRCVEPIEPDPAMRAWVRSRAIAYAKALQARREGAL
jgi:DNA repair protein RadD